MSILPLKQNKIFKIAILGDGASGKTSLLRARKDAIFTENSSITIGVDFQCIPFEYKKSEGTSSFLAFDLGGQKRFHFIHDAYLPGIKLAIILYDLSRYSTFLNIPKWYNLVFNENPLIPVSIVGSKADLVSDDKQQIFREEFKVMKEKLPNHANIFGHYFVSSKTRTGIDQLFFNCEKMMNYCV